LRHRKMGQGSKQDATRLRSNEGITESSDEEKSKGKRAGKKERRPAAIPRCTERQEKKSLGEGFR